MSAETILMSLRSVAEKIATELVFAEPGKDNGLLPINCLLLELQELAGSHPASQPLVRGVEAGRSCVDGIFAGTGFFSESSIAALSQWAAWFQEAVSALEAGGPIAPPPSLELKSAAAPAKSGEKANHAATAHDSALVLNISQDAELIREFIHEGNEHLQVIEQGVLTLEESPSDPDTLNAIFRAFHTFKGGAGFLNLVPMHDLAHHLESLLDLARQHKLVISRTIIDLILEGGDLLKTFCGAIASQLAGDQSSATLTIPVAGLIVRVQAAISGQASEPTAPTASGAPAPEAASAAESAGPAAPAAEAKGTASSVKVDTQKLDGLIDAVGEMVIAQSLVVQNQALRALDNEQLSRNLAELGRITKELQRTAMSLRMVPIRSTFQKMHRVVRDTTAKLGKKVELVTEGEDTELDRSIVEEISDPLIHMVRNSVDHGVEMPDGRVAAGKPEKGTVWLRAFHQGGNIVIEIKDDGKGLDRAAILAKAVEKGIVPPGESLSDEEIFKLIFAPGFSTAAKVTELSGRGVGMDVVRRNVEKLRGKIDISSTPGQGTTFSIFLPLTLAIIDGLLVGVGEHRYIIPTLTISESFRPAAGAVKTVQGRGEMVEVRGRLRPLLRLYNDLGLEPASTDPTQSIVVVVQSTSDARCILVDRLLGKQEVVIKSLGDSFRANRYVAGAAILGDGRVGLILDSQALVQGEEAGFRRMGAPDSLACLN